MKLVLQAEPSICSADLPMDVQSISSSGLVVLSCGRVPPGVDGGLRPGSPEEGTELRFVLEIGGRHCPLQARLVWAEVSGAADEPDFELIVDGGEEPGWQELRRTLAHG